jgi:saccharopine dehydrogenase-like NADP-dependent oxidoreductase
MLNKILVLGGYGNFGKLICEYLGQRSDIELTIAGRNKQKADRLCDSLRSGKALSQLSSLQIDIHSDKFQKTLSEIKPNIVIHTCGPFQGQDYHVPKACIESGCHYIDLADDRRFVCDFPPLDVLAKKNNVIAISGASSVPGLSSVIIDHYITEFSEIKDIEFFIVPGSNVDIGEATLSGILSYVGRAFKTWEQGISTERYGWMDNRYKQFGNTLGKRWLANVDIPDLELFPPRYPDLQNVRFQAGHELGMVHLTLAFMAILSRIGIVKHWEHHSKIILKIGNYIKNLDSDCGGMVIQLTGINKDNKQQKITWRLIANSGVGPRIPTISAIILTNQILDGELTEIGARPCLGMYSPEDFFKIARNWGIYEEVERSIG